MFKNGRPRTIVGHMLEEKNINRKRTCRVLLYTTKRTIHHRSCSTYCRISAEVINISWIGWVHMTESFDVTEKGFLFSCFSFCFALSDFLTLLQFLVSRTIKRFAFCVSKNFIWFDHVLLIVYDLYAISVTFTSLHIFFQGVNISWWMRTTPQWKDYMTSCEIKTVCMN